MTRTNTNRILLPVTAKGAEMPLAYFDMDDLKVAFEAFALMAIAFGFLGYVAGFLFQQAVCALAALLRRRGASAPFDQRVIAAQRRHVLMARVLQARINRESQRLAQVPKVGNK